MLRLLPLSVLQACTARCRSRWPPLARTSGTRPACCRRAATAPPRCLRKSTWNAVRGGWGWGRGLRLRDALLTSAVAPRQAHTLPAPHSCCPYSCPLDLAPAAAPELAALAISKLDSALRELEVTGAADYVAHHAPPPRPRGRRQSEAHELPAAVKAEGEGGSEAPGSSGREASAEPGAEASAAEGSQAQRQLTDAVRDMDRCARGLLALVAAAAAAGRPAAAGGEAWACARVLLMTRVCLHTHPAGPLRPSRRPAAGRAAWSAGVVSAGADRQPAPFGPLAHLPAHPCPSPHPHPGAADDDPARLLPCDACDCKHHSYCVEPPLEELPLAAVRSAWVGCAVELGLGPFPHALPASVLQNSSIDLNPCPPSPECCRSRSCARAAASCRAPARAPAASRSPSSLRAPLAALRPGAWPGCWRSATTGGRVGGWGGRADTCREGPRMRPCSLSCHPRPPIPPPPRSEWTAGDRCSLLRLLCSLSAESTQLHNALGGEEDAVSGRAGAGGLDTAGQRGCRQWPKLSPGT